MDAMAAAKNTEEIIFSLEYSTTSVGYIFGAHLICLTRRHIVYVVSMAFSSEYGLNGTPNYYYCWPRSSHKTKFAFYKI